jgi:hypothetical protein
LAIASERDRVTVARHVLECPRCAEELQVLREFLAPQTADRGVLEHVARIFATMVPPLQPAGAFRGSVDSGDLTFRAGALGVQLKCIPAQRPGDATIMGLVWSDDDPGADLAGEALLLDTGGVEVRARIDHLGNFAFESVGEGTHQLELSVAEHVVVVEDLRFRS